MALKWTTTSAAAQDHGIKCLIYGLSGAGKTTLAASAPRPIIASAESGTLSIAKHNITMAEIKSYADLLEFYNWAKGSASASGYDTLYIDSLSEIYERILAEEKGKTKDPRKAYGEMADQMITLVKSFRDLPGLNVCFTAKASVVDTPDKGVQYNVMVPGKSNGPNLAYYFDELFYLGVGEVQSTTIGGPPVKYRYLQTELTPQVAAQDRSGVLDSMERPDLSYIFTKIATATSLPPATA
jgi:hypothetical protein